MRLVLNLQGPDFEVSLNGDSLTLSSHGNVITFDHKHLQIVIAQLELLGRMVEVSGSARVSVAPEAVSPAADALAVSPVIATLKERVRAPRAGATAVPAGAGPANVAAPVVESAAASAGARPARRRGESRGALPQQGPRLHDHLHKFLSEKGPATTEDLIAHVRRRKLSDASNLKLAVTIALGRERQRFNKLPDGRWDAIKAG